MTARDLATLLHARKVGKGRWFARCPVHHEQTASLSIRQMPDGIAAHCFGCNAGTRQVAKALRVNLWESYDPEIARQIRAMEARQEREHRQRRAMVHLALERAAVWDAVLRRLGALWRAFPDSDEVAGLMERTIAYKARAERIADLYDYPHCCGLGSPPLPKRRPLTAADVGPELAARLGLIPPERTVSYAYESNSFHAPDVDRRTLAPVRGTAAIE